MKVGIGLPVTLAGITSDQLLDWARKADAGPFSSLGAIDRLVYHSYEVMVTLAAVASVTQRVRLMSTLIQAPLRNGGILAKQAATLDALSGGRLTLGLGVGRREDDFRAAPASLRGRSARFEEQIALMRKAWAGEALAEDVGPIGPPPGKQGGPEILIGGTAPAGLNRCGRLADGYLSAIETPANLRKWYDVVEESWKEAGREGSPRWVGFFYFALTPDAADRAAAYLRHYYAFMGPGAEHFVNFALTSPEAIMNTVRDYANIGMDEVVFYPCAADLDQIDRLADLLG